MSKINAYIKRSYLQYRLKLSYEDRILANTVEWTHTNNIVRSAKGDKSGIVKAIHDLTEKGYLDSKKESNRVLYKRNDEASDSSFRRSMKTHQWNYDQVLTVLDKTPQLSTKNGELSSKAKSLLKHLEYLLDRNMILIVRINYQKNLGLVSKKIAGQRITMVDELVSKVTEKINTKYEKEQKMIQNYFQDHNKEIRFKI